MRIIAQKSNTLTTRDFFVNGLTKDFIDAMSFNVAYTKDNKIVIFNPDDSGIPITNTINGNNFNELKDYELVLLEDVLSNLNNLPKKKDLYINLSPSNPSVLNETNLQEANARMNDYVNELNRIIEQNQNLTIHVHSISRNLITVLKRQNPNYKIGFAMTGIDFNFIDVDYYVLISNTQDDLVIDTLLDQGKEVILYVYSNYYTAYIYEHYQGEKSTPHLQEVLTKIGIMSNYPEIIHKLFETN